MSTKPQSTGANLWLHSSSSNFISLTTHDTSPPQMPPSSQNVPLNLSKGQPFQLVIPSRPDLERFQSPNHLLRNRAYWNTFLVPEPSGCQPEPSRSNPTPVEEEIAAFVFSEENPSHSGPSRTKIPAPTRSSLSPIRPPSKRLPSNDPRALPPKKIIKRGVDSVKKIQSKDSENDLVGRQDRTWLQPKRISSTLTNMHQNALLSSPQPPRSGPSKKPVSKRPAEPQRASSTQVAKAKRRTMSDSSDNPDDEDDLFLSDFSEPETKLRDKKNGARSKFAKLRKARHANEEKRAIKKKVHSHRVVPDSDSEGKAREDNESSSSDESDSDSDDDTTGSSSVTDKEEIARREKEFIVDDLSNRDTATRIKKRIAANMPAQFKRATQNNEAHFSNVCTYLVYCIFDPHANWWRRSDEYQQSYARVNAAINSRTSLLDSAAWAPSFRQALRCRPRIQRLKLKNPRVGCGACNNRVKHSTYVIILNGQKYDSGTLREMSSDSSSESSSDSDAPGTAISSKHRSTGRPHEDKFYCGQDCAKRAFEFHRFKHWHHHLIPQLTAEIQKLNSHTPSSKLTGPKPSKDEAMALRKQASQVGHALEDKAVFLNMFKTLMASLTRIDKEYATG